MRVPFSQKMFGKISITGCSKIFRYKAFEVLRKEAYIEVCRTDEG
jgi:hypothetical protein